MMNGWVIAGGIGVILAIALICGWCAFYRAWGEMDDVYLDRDSWGPL